MHNNNNNNKKRASTSAGAGKQPSLFPPLPLVNSLGEEVTGPSAAHEKSPFSSRTSTRHHGRAVVVSGRTKSPPATKAGRREHVVGLHKASGGHPLPSTTGSSLSRPDLTNGVLEEGVPHVTSAAQVQRHRNALPSPSIGEVDEAQRSSGSHCGQPLTPVAEVAITSDEPLLEEATNRANDRHCHRPHRPLAENKKRRWVVISSSESESDTSGGEEETPATPYRITSLFSFLPPEGAGSRPTEPPPPLFDPAPRFTRVPGAPGHDATEVANGEPDMSPAIFLTVSKEEELSMEENEQYRHLSMELFSTPLVVRDKGRSLASAIELQATPQPHDLECIPSSGAEENPANLYSPDPLSLGSGARSASRASMESTKDLALTNCSEPGHKSRSSSEAVIQGGASLDPLRSCTGIYSLFPVEN